MNGDIVLQLIQCAERCHVKIQSVLPQERRTDFREGCDPAHLFFLGPEVLGVGRAGSAPVRERDLVINQPDACQTQDNIL